MSTDSAFLVEFANAATLAIIGAGAWLVQRYLGYWVWLFNYWQRGEELAVAVRGEIRTLVAGYRKTMPQEVIEAMKEDAGRVRRPRDKKPYLIADQSKRVVFDAINKDITGLPKEVIEDVVAFYTADDLYTAIYNLLGTVDFAKADKDSRELTIDELVFYNSECISLGESAITSINANLFELSNRRRQVFLWHGLATVVISLCGLQAWIWYSQ